MSRNHILSFFDSLRSLPQGSSRTLLTKEQGLKWLHYSTFLMAASLLSLYYTELHFLLCIEAKRASLSLLLEYSADVPFQYRVLIPWIVNFLLKLKLPFFDSSIRLFKTIEFLSMFSLVIAFRFYLSFFIKNSILTSIFSLALLILLPYQYIFYSWTLNAIYYPYDTPSVLFFTLGLIFIYKKNWFIYYPLFIVATFNRETTVFLVFVFLFTTIEKNKVKPVLFHAFSQVLIWMLIKKYLGDLYGNNPGQGYFINFFYINLSVATNPLNIIRMASSFGFIWVAVIFYFKLIADKFVERSLLVVFPFLLGMFIVGTITELRIYGELIPVVLSAFLLIVNNLLRLDNLQDAIIYNAAIK